MKPMFFEVDVRETESGDYIATKAMNWDHNTPFVLTNNIVSKLLHEQSGVVIGIGETPKLAIHCYFDRVCSEE